MMKTIDSFTDEELIVKFRTLSSGRDIAEILGVPYNKLTFLLYGHHERLVYATFYLRKKSGGTREICAPSPSIKYLQQKLCRVFQLIYQPRRCVCGFAPNTSIVKNARKHLRKKYVLNVDLKNFFPSIHFGRIYGMLQAKPYNIPKEAAAVLAHLCCCDKRLPQGAPTSPVISNMICAKLDGELLRLAKLYGCTYSRYADDITLSKSSGVFPAALAEESEVEGKIIYNVGEKLNSIIEDNGFSVNPTKVRLQRHSKRQEVTGIVVNEKLNLRRNYVRQIRAMLYSWRKFGLEAAEKEYWEKWMKRQSKPAKGNPSFTSVVSGKINYLRMVRGEDDLLYRKLSNAFGKLAGEPYPRYFDSIHDELIASLWVIECNTSSNQGTVFGLSDIGLVTCAHVVERMFVPTVHKPDDPETKYPVKTVKHDSKLDIAILEFDIPDPPPSYELRRSEGDSPKLSDDVVLGGFPHYGPGDSATIKEGHIIGFTGASRIRLIPHITIDAPIISGNSGGPLVNSKGRVIGIAARGAGDDEEAERTHRHEAIPISAIDELL